jgi:endo-1,4-beta-xylanase
MRMAALALGLVVAGQAAGLVVGAEHRAEAHSPRLGAVGEVGEVSATGQDGGTTGAAADGPSSTQAALSAKRRPQPTGTAGVRVTASAPAAGRSGQGTGGASGGPITGSLRDLAARRGVAVGAALTSSDMLSDTQYSGVLAQQYNMLTPDNDMKWATIHPAPLVYDFVPADLDMNFASSHQMAVRGHNLVWHQSNPAWLTNGNFNRDQLISILHDHISTVVGHYRGQIAQWDVVNEAVVPGGMRHDIWLDGIGPEYVDMAFRWAHEADPGAKLFYNDCGGEGLGSQSDTVYNLVRGMKARGVPIDGVGLQSHFDLSPPSMGAVAANMRRLAALGLETAVTEVDVRLHLPATSQDLSRQADVYRGLLATCLAAPRCRTFVSWGFTDKASWIPNAYPGYGAALPFDASYVAKPAYSGLEQALSG